MPDPRPRFFPVARAGLSPVIPGGEAIEETFPVAGFDRVASAGEITVFPASSSGRLLSCDEFDLSGSRVLVADGAGRVVASGDSFTHDPRRLWKSFQRQIPIPPGGMAVCLSKTADRAGGFYELAHENAFFSPSTTPVFADLRVFPGKGSLSFAYRPTALRPGPMADFLFVGNSGVYVYNIPTLFRDMARDAGRNVNADYCTFGGARLSQYADGTDDRGKALRAILAAKRYDFIVFHDASRAPAEETWRALEALVPLAGRNGAKPLLYMRYPAGSLCGEFQKWSKALFDCYTEAGRRFGMAVAPAAVAYFDCVAGHPGVDLYAEGRDHQSKAGAYLIACVLLRSFLGVDPIGSGFRSGLDHALEATLREVAAGSCARAGDPFAGRKVSLDLSPEGSSGRPR